MVISKKYRAKSFQDTNIPVEFVVLHYTAQSLEGSLKIFLEFKAKVSCHLLIDRDGMVYELVDCWDGVCKKAFHAGRSFFKDENKKDWNSFNNFSIGIELVNWNGNIFDFTKQQYKSLFTSLNHLKNQYPSLNNPNRILGHEHISGFRGKRDPGYLFDWPQLFKEVYHQDKKMETAFTKKQASFLLSLKKKKTWNDSKAKKISLILEKNKLAFWLKKLLFSFII